MRFTKLKIKLSIVFLAIILSGSKIYSQSSSDISIYNWFDSIIGKENLGINNGILYINSYHPFYKSHSYCATDKFTTGNVSYDDQLYYDVNLKYDIYKDILILNPHGEYSYSGLILIKSKVNSFFIDGKKFANLDLINSSLPEFINGFYEIIISNSKFSFYVKHHKYIKEIVKDLTVFNEFDENNQYVLNYKNIYFKINSKKDLINIFPEYKNKINEYFILNKEKQKLNRTEFMENLMISMNNYFPNTSK